MCSSVEPTVQLASELCARACGRRLSFPKPCVWPRACTLAAAFVCRDHSKLEISPGVVTSANTIGRAGADTWPQKTKFTCRDVKNAHLSCEQMCAITQLRGLGCPGADQTYLRATYGVNKNYADTEKRTQP